jgi:hypothetical protein
MGSRLDVELMESTDPSHLRSIWSLRLAEEFQARRYKMTAPAIDLSAAGAAGTDRLLGVQHTEALCRL